MTAGPKPAVDPRCRSERDPRRGDRDSTRSANIAEVEDLWPLEHEHRDRFTLTNHTGAEAREGLLHG